MPLMTIGEFARRTRLSTKALRLYDDLRLVVPAHVDPATGYRLYSEEQVGQARLVGQLRRLDMPLATISSMISADGSTAALALGQWWGQAEATTVDRRLLVRYLQAHLRGEEPAMYDVNLRSMPERRLLTISRHLTIGETDAFFADAFVRLRAGGPGLDGIAGVPFLIFYGEVSDDSDGPLELCRPVSAEAPPADGLGGDIQAVVEAAHDEAYIRVAKKDLGWPALLPACDALEAWVADRGREPAGPLRQVFIADQRSATPDTLVCDLSLPLR